MYDISVTLEVLKLPPVIVTLVSDEQPSNILDMSFALRV